MSAKHTEALADLRRQHAEETTAARTLDAEAEVAAAGLAAAPDAVVTAHADNNATAVKKATAARDKADARVAEFADKQAAAASASSVPSRRPRRTSSSTPAI
jgi:hypothetical protein